jgi:hypothetical protein
MRLIAVVPAYLVSASVPSQASETVVFTYDALGRLTSSTISGGPNGGVASTVGFDPAGNRTSAVVSGKASSARQVVATLRSADSEASADPNDPK